MRMRRVGNIAALCAAIAVCYGMQRTKPHYIDLTGPIPTYGGMREPVETLRFSVRVDDVVFARRLKLRQFGEDKMLTSSGLWAIVATELAATDASTSIAGAVWQGPGGLRYRPTERLGAHALMPPHGVDPGLPKKSLFIFEIPADQAEGATLMIANARYSALDAEARIPLDDIRPRPDGMPESFIMTYDLDKQGGGAAP